MRSSRQRGYEWPEDHVDLMGKALTEGDLVAYPVSSGSSAAKMVVGRILEFLPYDHVTTKWNREGPVEYVTCKRWKVRLQPERYTNYRSDTEYLGNSRWEEKEPKPVTITNVFNLVKV